MLAAQDQPDDIRAHEVPDVTEQMWRRAGKRSVQFWLVLMTIALIGIRLALPENHLIAATGTPPIGTPGTPLAAATPSGTTGSILVTRYNCASSAAVSRLDVFPLGTTVTTDDLVANGCTRSAAGLVLISNFGNTVQRFTVPATGVLVIQNLPPADPNTPGYRLLDTDSTASAYVTIVPDQATSVISYQYQPVEPTEIPFPTMAPFPTFPPFPTMAPFPTERPFPTFGADTSGSEGDDGSGDDSGYVAPKIPFKSTDDDHDKQLAFLGLAILAFIVLKIVTRKKKVDDDGSGTEAGLGKTSLRVAGKSNPTVVGKRTKKKRSGNKRY
jgi:hypothetical protein